MNNDSLVTMMFDNILLQKGEYFPSYVYRLMQFANFMEASNLLDILQISSARKIGETLPRWVVVLVSQNYPEKKISQIVDDNLLGTYWRSFIEESEVAQFFYDQKHKPATGRVLFNGEKTLLPFQSIKLCPDCFSESVKSYGVGIWQAQHQAATAFVCHKHQHVLYQRPVTQFKGLEFCQAFFDRDEYFQPQITIFHRWLDFETRRIFQMDSNLYREEVQLHKRVFMESSFYSSKPCLTTTNLNKQWIEALYKYLYFLFPYARSQAQLASQSPLFKPSDIMDVDKTTHPLIYLLFKYFYLFEFKA
ncbi:MAG: TniQ family protein [Paraglaciecola sp.]|uniref:TniQ family protein n=1 Tax=Paraglaciecola sp. TaxID=1920173 RepID=UPI00273E5C01|nr:TniQ family protein [Paraglaciecola sp.]MDP5031653.1 TniQ family protein [Paraglaciecola sp.]MDP5134089.1 TniQ family protein [Paraglaciecola sp.]